MRRLVILLLAGGTLVGCGSSDRESANPRDALKGLKPIKSGFANFAVRVDVDNPPPSIPGPIQVSVSGPIRSNGPTKIPSLDWRIAFAGFGQRFASRVVSTGTNAYVQLGGEDFAVGEQAIARTNQDVARTAKTAPRGLASLGVDPLDAVTDVKEVGPSKVGGTTTTRYSGRINLDRLLDQVGTFLSRLPQAQGSIAGTTVPQVQLTPERRTQLKRTLRTPSFTADVADDHTLRGLRITVPFVTPPDRQKAAGGLTGGKLGYRLSYTDVGGEQTITPPPNAAPLKDFVTELNRLLAQRGQGATAGG